MYRSGLLLIAKILAALITSMTAVFMQNAGNGPVMLFVLSLVCFYPRIGFTGPLVIVGFWIGPAIFAPAINGSGAEDIRGAITGSIVCGISGLLIDFAYRDVITNK